MNKLIKLGCIALAGTLLFSCETDPEKLEIVKPYPQLLANLLISLTAIEEKTILRSMNLHPRATACS